VTDLVTALLLLAVGLFLFAWGHWPRLVWWWGQRRLRDREEWARENLDDFARAFPGRCPVCSYHAFGVREHYVDPAERVPPHSCTETRP
jgi:hypothetical protein